MKAVILAGGEGTRLRPLTNTTPKSLLPICNVPFLEHQLELMAKHGITEAILLTGYLADAFEPFTAQMKARGITLEISREAEPLGTAGAVRSVLGRLDDEAIVFNGDVLTDLDLMKMIERHRENKAALSISLKPVDDAGPYGLVPTEDDGRVSAFLEKPPPEVARKGGNINAGTYVIDPRVLEDVPADETWSFERQVFPALVERGERVYGFVSDAYWLDIGTPERYLQAHWDVIEAKSHARVAGTRTGLVLIGANARADAGAVVGPRASLGPGAVVEHGATVVDSVLLEGARVTSGSSVRGSIIGPNTTVQGAAENQIVV